MVSVLREENKSFTYDKNCVTIIRDYTDRRIHSWE